VVVVAAVALLGALVTASALVATQSNESHSDKLIADLEKALADTTDADTRAGLEEKLRLAREAREQELDAGNAPVDQARLKEKEESLGKESAASDAGPKQHLPHSPAGDGYIVEGATPPLPSSSFSMRNEWFVETGPNSILVAYAGAEGQDRAQGEVVVMDEGPDGFRLVGRFPTPGKHGAVMVVGAAGRTIELRAEDGSTFDFDMDARVFR
jgi:hypothetical protein